MLYTSDKLQRLETVMNEELKLVFKYSITNKLSINLTKANYMVISSSRLNGSTHIIAQPVIMRSSKSHYSGQPLANVPSPTEQYPCGTR